MKSVTTKKCSSKFMIMFVAVAIATLLLLPQVPKTMAYFTSQIKSDEIRFTYEPIEVNVDAAYDDVSSTVGLFFRGYSVQEIELSSIELTYGTDTYTIEPLSYHNQDNQIVVYLDNEKVKSWLTDYFPENSFNIQISGEGDYGEGDNRGARILFTGWISIPLIYEETSIAPPAGAVEPAMPPGESLVELPEGSEELPESDVPPSGETDLIAPTPENDPVSEVPSEEQPVVEVPDVPEEPSEGQADGVIEEEAQKSENSSEEPTEEPTEEPAEEPTEEATEEATEGQAEEKSEVSEESTQESAEEAPPIEVSDDEEQSGSGGETQHD